MSYVTNSFDDRVVELLQGGGVGFMPSDTIYGLSCRALDEKTVHRLHGIKERGPEKPFIVLISDKKMLNMLSISIRDHSLLDKYWPSALSVVLPAPNAPSWLQLHTQTLAVRMPDYPKLQKLINLTGPLISTSANLASQEPAKTVERAKKYFGDELDFYVDAGLLDRPPSTVAALKNGRLEVLREGAVKIEA